MLIYQRVWVVKNGSNGLGFTMGSITSSWVLPKKNRKNKTIFFGPCLMGSTTEKNGCFTIVQRVNFTTWDMTGMMFMDSGFIIPWPDCCSKNGWWFGSFFFLK